MAAAGVTVMDDKVAALMVNVAVSVTDPKAAVITVAPVPTDVASPLEPAALLIVATELSDEVQTTDWVMSCVVLSSYVPVAVNCNEVPRAMVEVADEIAMDTSVAEVTVSEDAPDTLPDHAVMVVVPVATGVASPLEPAALLTIATPVSDDNHVTCEVMSCAVPSE